MTLTTELLKGCGRGSYPHFCGEKIKGISNSGDLCPECKSELKGRLDALKEEVEWLKKLQIEIEDLENAYTDGFGQNEFNIDVSKRLASIQEEIKLIENAGVGK
jgi:hypothetical protein